MNIRTGGTHKGKIYLLIWYTHDIATAQTNLLNLCCLNMDVEIAESVGHPQTLCIGDEVKWT